MNPGKVLGPETKRRQAHELEPQPPPTAAGHSPPAAPLPFAARSQGLPETARIFVGFAAGGTVDVTARRTGDKLRDAFAKSIVVENRTGAGGQIALTALKTATPDGLTFGLTPMSMLGIYPHTYRSCYDPIADFSAGVAGGALRFRLCGRPAGAASVHNLQEFVAWCKANPKEANYGSPAAGSVPHFVAELFGRAAGFDFRHVPYRGTQPAIADLMGGQVAAVSGPVGEFLQHLPTGKVRLLATSGAARNKFAPNVPTYAEQGFKDIVFDEWFGYFLPAKASPDSVNKLAAALRTALASQEVIDGLAQMGLEARSSTPAELAAMLKKDSERWAPLIKTIGFGGVVRETPRSLRSLPRGASPDTKVGGPWVRRRPAARSGAACKAVPERPDGTEMASTPLQVAGVEVSPDHYIDGRRVASPQTFALHCPIDQRLLGEVSEGIEEHVETAIRAAQAAFPAWSALSAAERKPLLDRFADEIGKRADAFCVVESNDAGVLLSRMRHGVVPRAMLNITWFAEHALTLQDRPIPTEQARCRAP